MNGNPFYVQPAGNYGAALQGIGSILQKDRERSEEQERIASAKLERQKAVEAVQKAVASNDPVQVRNAMIQYPSMNEVMKNSFGFANDVTKGIATDTYGRVMGYKNSPDLAIKEMEQGIARIEAAGGSPTMMRSDLERLKTNPDQAFNAVEMGFAGVAPEAHKAYRDTIKSTEDMSIEKQKIQMRKEENASRRIEAQLKRTDNALKREELQLKIDEKKAKIAEFKQSLKTTTDQGVTAIDNSISAIDRLLDHEGLESAVGTSSLLPSIPGTSRASFEAELEAFDAKNFLSQIKQMKGMGSLSDAEGKKVSAAVGAINPKMKEEDFIKSLELIKSTFQKARERVRPESAPNATKAPESAVNMLMQNPDLADNFKAKYGYLPEGM